jgi:hypothetical protein
MSDELALRFSALERRWRILVGLQGALFLGFAALLVSWSRVPQTPQEPKALTVSELAVVDENGTVRARIAGQVPDAIIDGERVRRGGRAAGVVLYDDTGAERSGYLTFSSPTSNVVLTLDNRRSSQNGQRQTALFAAGADGGSALRLWYNDNAVELNVGAEGPVIHATQDKRAAFHEPPVQNPEQTEMCQELRQARTRFSDPQLFDMCVNRSSEAACRACLATK